MTVTTNGKSRKITSPDAIPAGAFTVTKANLSDAKDFNDASLARLTGFDDLAFLNLAGRRDAAFPNVASIELAHERASEVYSLLGVKERIGNHIHPGGHGFPADVRRMAYGWLAERLGVGGPCARG